MTDTKKTSGLTRRQALAGAAGIFVGGVVAKGADEATKQSKRDAVEEAEAERTQRLAIALEKETGGQWSVAKDGWATRETVDGNLKHTEKVYPRPYGGGTVSYSLTTVSDKKRVEVQLEYDRNTNGNVLPKETPFEPEDRKIIEVLMKAQTNMLSASRTQGNRFDYVGEMDIPADIGVKISAQFLDDAVVFRTRPKDGSVPVEYVYSHKDRNGRSITPIWIVRSGQKNDHIFSRPDKSLTRYEDNRPQTLERIRDLDEKVGTEYSIPALTGDRDLRSHVQTLAETIRKHGDLRVEQKPGIITALGRRLGL